MPISRAITGTVIYVLGDIVPLIEVRRDAFLHLGPSIIAGILPCEFFEGPAEVFLVVVAHLKCDFLNGVI